MFQSVDRVAEHCACQVYLCLACTCLEDDSRTERETRLASERRLLSGCQKSVVKSVMNGKGGDPAAREIIHN